MRETLEQLWTKLHPKPNREDEPEWLGPRTLREPLYHAWETFRLKFYKMLDAEAYLDAAMMLAPDRYRVQIRGTIGKDNFNVRLLERKTGLEKSVLGIGTTPALALVAAIERINNYGSY